MSRKRGRVDLPEYASMARRISRGYMRRFEQEGSLEDVAEMLDVAEEMLASVGIVVSDMRSHHSWAEIGDALGVSGEAARQRWSSYDEDMTLPAGPGIYALCDETGVRYVGKSISVRRRIFGYRRGRGHTQALGEWLRPRRNTFTVRVLEECETPRELSAAESRWIAHHVEEVGQGLLNHSQVPGRGRRRTTTSFCGKTEMRWASGSRRVPPSIVTCYLEPGHSSDCISSGKPFGQQPATSTYSRYMAAQGVIITLNDKAPPSEK